MNRMKQSDLGEYFVNGTAVQYVFWHCRASYGFPGYVSGEASNMKLLYSPGHEIALLTSYDWAVIALKHVRFDFKDIIGVWPDWASYSRATAQQITRTGVLLHADYRYLGRPELKDVIKNLRGEIDTPKEMTLW